MGERLFRCVGVGAVALCAVLPVGCQFAGTAGPSPAGRPPGEGLLAGAPRDVVGAAAVRIRFGLPEGGRAVQATVADVDHVNLVLSQLGHTDRSQTIAKANVGADGHATATFDLVWPGDATIHARVYDASGATIGSASATAGILSGQTIAVNLAITLVPTIVSIAP